MRLQVLLLCLASADSASAFVGSGLQPRKQLRYAPRLGETAASAISPSDVDYLSLSPKERKKKEQAELVRKEGGLFAFNTKFGGLNPYAIYYGVVAILLGIPWFLALNLCQLMNFVTRNRFDRKKRIPIFVTQLWGRTLMKLTRQTPDIVNKDMLKKFFKEERPAMFVANHASWQDIPMLGTTIGWRNYKMVAKKELEKVPILGRSIKVGGHLMVDRTDRRSQLKTLKDGIGCLENGVNLCTFPEGTRTKTGRLGSFKNGAFKMAYKAGAPVIPISIVGSGKVHPPHWIFPKQPARGTAKVIVHEPVECTGKTEEEVAEQVRAAMIAGLPEDQRPANN